MAGSTVADLNSKLTSSIDELTILTSSIQKSFNTYKRDSTTASSQDLSMKKDIRELNEKAETYDRQFEEEESRLQAYGGKTRKQTLQEFILLFFYIGYGLLSASIILYAHRTNIPGYPLKICGILLFILFMITAVILKYA
jgi:lipopolysaccharide export LptBFGC system permease protein LptF